MNERLAQRFDAALHHEEPELALRAIVRKLLESGKSRRELVDILEEYRLRLEDRGEDEDPVLDLMDVLAGWASETAVRNLMPPPCKAPRAVSLS